MNGTVKWVYFITLVGNNQDSIWDYSPIQKIINEELAKKNKQNGKIYSSEKRRQ